MGELGTCWCGYPWGSWNHSTVYKHGLVSFPALSQKTQVNQGLKERKISSGLEQQSLSPCHMASLSLGRGKKEHKGRNTQWSRMAYLTAARKQERSISPKSLKVWLYLWNTVSMSSEPSWSPHSKNAPTYEYSSNTGNWSREHWRV